MLNIILINLPKKYELNINKTYYELIKGANELSLLNDFNETNNPIYVMPHKKSLLREFIIQPNLSKKGYINELSLNKEKECTIKGINFKYIITKNF